MDGALVAQHLNRSFSLREGKATWGWECIRKKHNTSAPAVVEPRGFIFPYLRLGAMSCALSVYL